VRLPEHGHEVNPALYVAPCFRGRKPCVATLRPARLTPGQARPRARSSSVGCCGRFRSARRRVHYCILSTEVRKGRYETKQGVLAQGAHTRPHHCIEPRVGVYARMSDALFVRTVLCRVRGRAHNARHAPFSSLLPWSIRPAEIRALWWPV
jgi:hypothetical protein